MRGDAKPSMRTEMVALAMRSVLRKDRFLLRLEAMADHHGPTWREGWQTALIDLIGDPEVAWEIENAIVRAAE